MTESQAIEWQTIISDATNRESCLNWLMHNDPVVWSIYERLRLARVSDSHKHLAAVLILVKLRSQPAPLGVTPDAKTSS